MKRNWLLVLCLFVIGISLSFAADNRLRPAFQSNSDRDVFISANASVPQARKQYDENGDRIFESLSARMAAAGPDEQIPVIVLFKQNTPTAGTYATRLSQVTGVQHVRNVYKNLPAVAASLTRSQIEKLSKDGWVEQIELDMKGKINLWTASIWFGVLDAQFQFGFSGDRDGISGNYSKNDVVVAIADTGINPNHEDLRGKVLAWNDYVNGQSNPYDDQGHGTAVSGIVAGAGKKNFLLAGVAYEAALVVLKVADSTGATMDSIVMQAVDDVITNRSEFNIRVLNLSLEFGGSSNGKDALSLLCNRAVSNGIVVVAAAGNSGPGAQTIGTPAAANSIITVGAGADVGEKGFFLADFSSRGPTADGRIKPDLWGPGVKVRSTSKGGGYIDLSGTSFASPFVAGVVALMIEANPSLQPAAIKSILTGTAERWGPGRNNEAGFGRLQAYQAISKAGRITQNLDPPDVPRAGFATGTLSAGQSEEFILNMTKKFPIAITLVVSNHPAADLDVFLLDQSGRELARGFTLKRQETISFKPISDGTYTIRVRAANSSPASSYLMNISADWSQ